MTFIINHIQEILPLIKDKEEFLVMIKGDYIVIDYVFETNKTFDDPRLLNLRGIKFNLDGSILSRTIPKFFNYGQREIVYNWDEPHYIFTKEDGSMVHTSVINGELRLMTRGGITDHSVLAEAQCSEQLRGMRDKLYNDYKSGYIHHFEFVSPDNQIVVPYEKPQLIYLTTIDNSNGASYYFGDDFPISAATHIIDFKSMDFDKFRAEIVDMEGFVIHWPKSGVRCKIKGDEYVSMHRVVSSFNREDFVIETILNGTVDDIYPLIKYQSKKDKLSEYSDYVNLQWAVMTGGLQNVVDLYGDLPRKDFALLVKSNVPVELHGAYFRAYDGDNPRKCIAAAIKRNYSKLLNVRW